jgi:hypothetical protein
MCSSRRMLHQMRQADDGSSGMWWCHQPISPGSPHLQQVLLRCHLAAVSGEHDGHAVDTLDSKHTCSSGTGWIQVTIAALPCSYATFNLIHTSTAAAVARMPHKSDAGVRAGQHAAMARHEPHLHVLCIQCCATPQAAVPPDPAVLQPTWQRELAGVSLRLLHDVPGPAILVYDVAQLGGE